MSTLDDLLSRAVVNERGCLIWQGKRDDDGYGLFYEADATEPKSEKAKP
jgi:hypothetical protein